MEYNNTNRYFGLNKHVMSFLHHVVLLAMLHSSFVAPAQGIVEAYINKNSIVEKKGYYGNAYSNEEIHKEIEKNIEHKPKVASAYKKYSSVQSSLNSTVFETNADLKEGVIGVSKDKPLDNPSDNIFKVNLKQLPVGNDKVYLTYELFGVADHQSVARSINERLSVGGYLVKKQEGWSQQKEEINPLWLKQGANTILFTIANGADYQYKVRNLSVIIEKSKELNSLLVFQNNKFTFSKDNKVYIKGFIRGSHPAGKIEAGGSVLQLSDNEFEGYVSLTDEIKKNGFLMIKASENNQLLGQEILFIDNTIEADKIFPFEKKEEAVTKFFKAREASKLDIEGAAIVVNDSALAKDYTISISRLRNIDIAPMESGLINVTKGGKGYRFLPDGTKFEKPVSLSIAYDSGLIPTGYTEKDIKTYFFDTNSKRWVAVHKDSIDVKNNTIISKTTHFTDYINGIIQAPDSPETSAFTPTMMSDIKAADPAAEMTIISPPSASQKGDANVSYPIKLPSGRRGIQPELALQYSNEGGNSWLGLGWNLSVPALSIDTKWGVPMFDVVGETEIYSLNGEQLMYPNGYLPHRHQDASGGTMTTALQTRNGSGVKVFYPRKQGSFAKIERFGNTPQTYYWKVTNTNGTISWYGGKTPDDVQNNKAVLKDSQNRIVHWALFKVEDVYGNNMTYTYETFTDQNTASNLYKGQQLYIKNINYTGYGNDLGNYDVDFLRKISRPDVNINARLGIKQVDFHLLERIKISYKTKLFRSYLLNYSTGRFNKSLLKSISELDENGNEFYSHSFDYYDDVKQSNNTEMYFSAEIVEKICTDLPEGETDTDNDGVPDSEDGCIDVPGSASNGGCPEIIPGGPTGPTDTDPATGQKLYCYTLDFSMPLKNRRFLYLFKGGSGDFGCAFSTCRFKDIILNGTIYTAPPNLYTSNYTNNFGFVNKCPSYPVTASEDNPDPVIQNPLFSQNLKNWLQNQPLLSYLDANSNLTITNGSGVFLLNGNVLTSHDYKITFESNFKFSGKNSTETYHVNQDIAATYTVDYIRRVISANGENVTVLIDGNTISPTPFNLYENFDSFESIVESIYGGNVTREFNLNQQQGNGNYLGLEDYGIIKFHNVNAPMSTVTIGGKTYNLKPCKDPDNPEGHRSSAKKEQTALMMHENGYNIDFQASVPVGDPDCPSLLNLDFKIQGNIPSYNSAASMLGSSKTEGYSLGASLGLGIGCKQWTKNTTFGYQKTFSYDKSGSFSAMIDIDGDGLDDYIYKGYNGSLYYSKHNVERTYENGQLKIKHTYSPSEIITGINNFYKGNSTSKTNNFQVTFGFSRLGGFAGIDFSNTKSETNVYFTDANGDGLPDIVKNETVFFNRIVNGKPEFVPNSMGSPNLIIKAEPKGVEVPPEYNEGEIDIPDYDVIKVWEAPYSGAIRITNDIVLSDTSQEVVVTVESRTKDIVTGGGCLLYGAVLDSGTPEIHNIVTTPMNPCNHDNSPNGIGVNQGGLVFFRVHATKTGINPKVDWDPKIEYINIPTILDQNGLSPHSYQYSEDFLLTQKNSQVVFPGNGTATITWDDIAVNAPSDDVTFEIYQTEISTNANNDVENSTSNDQLIYSKFCPAGGNTLVSSTNNDISGTINNIVITSNDTPGSNNNTTVFYFKIKADSNVNWKQIEWKPRVTCNTQETVIGVDNIAEGIVTTNETYFGIPDVSIYKVYNRDLPSYAPFNNYVSQNSANWPINSFGQTLYMMPHLTGIFSSADNGIIKFVVKRNGLVVGKREININNGNVSFDNNNPINLGPQLNDQLEIGFYTDDAELTNSSLSLLKKLFIYNLDFSDNQLLNVVRIAAGNWASGNSIFLTNREVMLYHIPAQKFGPMHRQWGQFAYNPSLVSVATVTAFGNLVNANVLVVEPNTNELQQAVTTLEGYGENITEQNLIDFQSQYEYMYSKIPFFPMYPKREVVDSVLREKWQGTCPQNYASALSYRAAGMEEIRDDFVDPDDYTVQEVLETGAYGINKYSKGKSKNVSAGANLDLGTSTSFGVGASVSKSLDAYNNSLTDYVDLNGDRYPDIVTTDQIQYTRRTGGLQSSVSSNSNINGVGGAQITKSTNSNLGFAASGSYTMGARPDSNIDGLGLSKPRFIGFKGHNGAGISGNFSTGNSQTNRMWADVNGDGLADILEKSDNGIQVRLNMGNNQFQAMQVNATSWGLNEMFNSTSHSYGGGIGVNKWNGSVELGVSLGSGRNNVVNTLIDMNGDGIADVVHSDSNGILVRVNRGNGFSPEIRWSNFRMNHESEVNNSSKNLGATFALTFPIPFLGICIKIPAINFNGSDYSSTNRTKKSISDFDGDGFPDLIKEISSSELRVQYSNIRRTNMLKSVENPLGGKFTVDYDVIVPTYNNPNPKWVLKNVVIEDGYDLVNDGVDTYSKNFEYENGYYDRRERDFYGYEKVKTIDNILNDKGDVTGVYRTSISVFHNRSYYLNGLPKWSYLIKGNDENQIFSRTINNYKLKRLTNAGLIDLTAAAVPLTFDTGGAEGRRAAAVVLESTENHIFELGTTPLISSVLFTYDERARVTKYKYKGNIAVAEDDYTTEISYYSNPTLESKNIYTVPGAITVKDHNNIERRKRVNAGIDNNTGAITVMSAKIDANTWADTQMGYDQYGNLSYVNLSPNDNGQQFGYIYEYDIDDHKLPISIQDSFGYMSYNSYDNRFDKPTVTTDITGNKIIYAYDNFSRLVTIQSPKEQSTSVPYTISFAYYPKYNILGKVYDCIDGEKFMPIAITSHYDPQHPGNDIQTYTFVDGLGRPVQVKKDIEINFGSSASPKLKEAVSISGKVSYDHYGRAIKQYHPYFENKECSLNLVINEHESDYFSTTKFDEADRQIESIDPENNSTLLEYSIGTDLNSKPALKTKTTTDQNGSQSIISESYKDVNGRVTFTKNILTGTGAADIWTSFKYNAIGELMSYTDAQDLSTKYKYDLLGRKTEIVHPDNGKTTYYYDTAGNLTKLQTANLENDFSIQPQDRYIKYLYDYNRLEKIMYPPTPSGDNIANVSYVYGVSGNDTGRLTEQYDATGLQKFGYGDMGEMVYNTRIVVGPHIPTRTFNTYFSYDSWNRINTITYPDGEEVTHEYNLGGNLVKMSGTVDGNPYDYIKRIDYDYFEQRTYQLYGNGTDMAYNYTPALRRLNTMVARTSTQENFLDNVYNYDKVGNVTGLVNNAVANSSNKMGGFFQHTYSYDNLNRLVGANGNFSGDDSQQNNNNDYTSAYALIMTYNTTHSITEKRQEHSKNQQGFDKNTYQNGYEYYDGTHQVQKITDTNTQTVDDFKYDFNGNIDDITSSGTGVIKNFFWDESNRLRAIDDQQSMQHYIYDASGERVLKASAQPEQLYNNGLPVDGDISFDSYTTYPSAYIVVNPDGRFSKHYYAGSQRIVSRVADKDARIFEGSPAPRPSGNKTNSDEKTFSEDKLRKLQISDLTQILEKAQRGMPIFKKYKPEDKEKESDTEEQDITSRTAQKGPPQVALYYYHPDHLGTSTFLTDSNGELYQFFLNLPFGETMAEQHSLTGDYETPFKFNGKELDSETGLYYYGARYYDPRTSIFISVDPLVEKTMDAYGYCYQNPINLIDPTGMSAEDGDIYNLKGKKIGSDGIEDKKVYLKYTNDNSQLTKEQSIADIEGAKSSVFSLTTEKNITSDELNMRATLSTIRTTEGHGTVIGYDSQFGNNTIDNYDDHPNKVISRWGHSSSAAGAYQFLSGIWGELSKKYGYTNFSPINQDNAAIHLLSGVKGAIDAIFAGDYNTTFDKLNGKWTSLPGGKHEWKSSSTVNEIFLKYRANELRGQSILATPQGLLIPKK